MLFGMPSFIQFVTLKMIDKDYIKKYRNPLQRYNHIVQKEKLQKFDILLSKLNVLRLTLGRYKSKAIPTMETILD